MEKILLAYLAKTLNKSTEEVATLIQNDDEDKSIKDDALDQLLELDIERVSQLKGKSSDSKEQFDNGYKKATAEILSKRDNDIKEHYGVTSELKGLDLISEVLDAKTKSLKNKEITSDEIKKSTTYQSAIQTLKKKHEDNVTEITNKHQDIISGYERKHNLVSVIQTADQLIDTQIKPLFSKDPARALSQRKKIHEGISKGNFKNNESGMPIMLNSEGKALEDSHGNPVPFLSFVTNEVTSILDLQTSKPRESAGDVTEALVSKLQDGFNWNGQKPTNDEEFIKATKEANSSEEKMAILKSYREE